ncbi:MAG TPA: amidohydrolase family protein [Candidatus Binataceae bacterium]|nr:amidohydrolase family protein [Candidatus Binataceae bacterium]
MAIAFIDADSHVYEVEETWDFLPRKFQNRRPIPITVPPEKAPYMGVDNAFWLVDGQAVQWTWGPGTIQIGTPLTSIHAHRKAYGVGHQSLTDVPQRLKALDDAGIDLQVVYSSLFGTSLSRDDEFESALQISYNHWIAERCAESDRLRWVAVVPMRTPELAVKEIERVKKAGAVGLMTLGTVGSKLLNAPEFEKIWAAAADHDLPVAVHVGWSDPGTRFMADEHMSALNISFTLPVLFGFVSFTGGGILERHPNLRVVFLEAGAGWIPWFFERVDHYHPVAHFFRNSFGLEPISRERPETYKDRVYATCEADERLLPQVIEFLGESNIMVSEDMPHLEAREGAAHELLARTDLTRAQTGKIMVDNPARFYGLDLKSLSQLRSAAKS